MKKNLALVAVMRWNDLLFEILAKKYHSHLIHLRALALFTRQVLPLRLAAKSARPIGEARQFPPYYCAPLLQLPPITMGLLRHWPGRREFSGKRNPLAL